MTHHSRSTSYASWLVWGSTGGTILLIVLGVVGWYLPVWAPIWVATHSPSLRYALRVIEPDDNADGDAIGVLASRA